MKNYLKKLTLLSTVILVSIVSCSKTDEDKTDEDKTDEPIASNFTVYKNQSDDLNADALQAQNIDKKGVLNFYGVFDSQKDPTKIRTITYQKTNNDTIVNLIIDPLTNRLASSYFSVKGVNSPVVLKFDYIDGVANAYNLSYFNYNWGNQTSELLFATRVETNNGVASSKPFFANRIKGDNFKIIAQSLAIGIVVVEVVVPILPGIITAGASVLAAAVAAPVLTAAAVGATLLFLIPKAGAAELNYSPSNSPPPSKTPIINPVPAASNPTPKLQTSSCVNTNMTFRASMDFEGSILISEVTGGKSPYTYTTGSGFQQSQVFSNKYKDGSYIVGVKDANGCVSIKLVPLKREANNCNTSTLAVTTSTTSNSATATATGGQSPYTYLWSNGNTSATATNLIGGTYTVTVTDGLGCTINGTVNIVSAKSLIGTWDMISADPPIGTFEFTQRYCGNIVTEETRLNSSQLVITKDKGTIIDNETKKNNNITLGKDSCSIVADLPDTYTDQTGSGSFTYDGNSFFIPGYTQGTIFTHPYTWITNDKIKVAERIYVRK